jgi:hypothetical protein
MKTIDEGAAGMTLRDYFAAAALQGLCMGLDRQGYPKLEMIEGWPQATLIAQTAMAVADAMLAERGRQ